MSQTITLFHSGQSSIQIVEDSGNYLIRTPQGYRLDVSLRNEDFEIETKDFNIKAGSPGEFLGKEINKLQTTTGGFFCLLWKELEYEMINYSLVLEKEGKEYRIHLKGEAEPIGEGEAFSLVYSGSLNFSTEINWQLDFDSAEDLYVVTNHSDMLLSENLSFWDFVEQQLKNYDEDHNYCVLYDNDGGASISCFGEADQRVLEACLMDKGEWKRIVLAKEKGAGNKESFVFSWSVGDRIEVPAEENFSPDEVISLFEHFYKEQSLPNTVQKIQKSYLDSGPESPNLKLNHVAEKHVRIPLIEYKASISKKKEIILELSAKTLTFSIEVQSLPVEIPAGGALIGESPLGVNSPALLEAVSVQHEGKSYGIDDFYFYIQPPSQLNELSLSIGARQKAPTDNPYWAFACSLNLPVSLLFDWEEQKEPGKHRITDLNDGSTMQLIGEKDQYLVLLHLPVNQEETYFILGKKGGSRIRAQVMGHEAIYKEVFSKAEAKEILQWFRAFQFIPEKYEMRPMRYPNLL